MHQDGNAWNPATDKTQFLRQIDLAGNIVRETNIGVIQQELVAAGAVDGGPCNVFPSPAPVGSACIGAFHHDSIMSLPNGYSASLVTAAGLGTFPVGIDPFGTIAGSFYDASSAVHGFVRGGGKMVVVDVPGAGSGAYQGTYPSSINMVGGIVGYYTDAGGVNHGFLRGPSGHITTFDVPGAGSGSGLGTFPNSSDPVAGTTGYYLDANAVVHGFLRLP
jgi:hypothetical protein